jgi:hypothetical protein
MRGEHKDAGRIDQLANAFFGFLFECLITHPDNLVEQQDIRLDPGADAKSQSQHHTLGVARIGNCRNSPSSLNSATLGTNSAICRVDRPRSLPRIRIFSKPVASVSIPTLRSVKHATRPAVSTIPRVGGYILAATRSSVVLPAPFATDQRYAGALLNMQRHIATCTYNDNASIAIVDCATTYSLRQYCRFD